MKRLKKENLEGSPQCFLWDSAKKIKQPKKADEVPSSCVRAAPQMLSRESGQEKSDRSPHSPISARKFISKKATSKKLIIGKKEGKKTAWGNWRRSLSCGLVN